MVLDGNIQVEIEALWDSYNVATDEEKAYILQEIERLYASVRDERVLEPA